MNTNRKTLVLLLAVILAFVKLPVNIFLTVLTAAVSAAVYMLASNLLTEVVLLGVVGMFFTRFAIEFSASRTVNKLLVNNANRVTVKYDEENIFDDNLSERIKRDEE